MVRFFKKSAVFASWIISAIIILIASFVMWGNHNGWEFDAILSGSMEPLFHVGGLVIIKPVYVERLNIGDIISFKLPNVNTPICHRIYDIQYLDGQEYFQTKGDANKTPDPNLVPLSSVQGEAIFHIPLVGHLIQLKDLSATKIDVVGKNLTASILFVLVMGSLLIGLILQETCEGIFFPSRKSRRNMLKKYNIRSAKRRQIFRS